MNRIIYYVSITLLTVVSSCGNKETNVSRKLTLDNCPVIAQVINLQGDPVTSLDFSSVKDTFNLSLSSLLSSFQVIRLENSEDALTAAGQDTHIAVSDHYILVKSFRAGSSCKLYNRTGDFIRKISSQGQGPDEYNLFIYDQYLDESNNKIYLMEIRASKILVFDFDGQPQKHIPLAYITHKGRFVINAEKKTVTVMCIPFQGTPTALIWTQDFEGNIIQEYPVSDQFMLIPSTYDYEVRESLNTTASDFYLHNCIASQDTLYHYDIDSNTLHPAFTMHTGHEPICHYFTELPNHFLVTWYTQTSWNNELPRFPKILVDKQSLKGCFVNLKWNMLGNIDGPTNPSFNRGYFTAIMEPYALKEQLEKVLTSTQKLFPEVLSKVKKLNNQITDDDNCIVFIGKLKTK